ncbi:MAG TPA: hypothetical protein VGW10_06760, partial [Solirubrobacteraceae bacterium]|nr:hypothetical protein [Solirubrobacteraceae bacterium]
MLAVFLAAAPAAAASERAHALDGSELNQWDKYFLARAKPIDIQPGLGPISMRVSTNDPNAQLWFNQGLAQLFGFAHEDAIWSFRKALEYDDRLAMAWWGIAWAYGPNINLGADAKRARAAHDAVQSARALLRFATDRERAYIDAISDRYDPRYEPVGDLPRRPLDVQFWERMNRLRASYPGDEHAATLTAEAGLDLDPWNQWTKEGAPTTYTRDVIAILEDVLKRVPDHVGAQHYYIHGVEAGPNPGDADLVAARIKSDAYGQPHLVHAASHIYARVGDWGSAMISGDDAEYQDELYLGRNGTDNLYTLAHGSHNIHFEASVASMGGRRRIA